MLLAFAPSRALAQAQSQLRAATGELRNLSDRPTETRTPLKAHFAESVSKIKAGGLTEADLRRFERQQQQQPPPKQKWSKGTKVFVIVLVAAVAAVCIWAIANPGDDPPPDCFNDPSNPLCS
jgi:hypothetical protein